MHFFNKIEVASEFDGQIFAEFGSFNFHFHVPDLFVLFAFSVFLELDFLPGQTALIQEHEHVPQGLQVVLPAQFVSFVSGDGGVPASAEKGSFFFKLAINVSLQAGDCPWGL